MGIYIKGIELPKDCDSCDIVKDCPLWYCTDVGARHPECPITEVKEPHGRLIDEDTIEMPLFESKADETWIEVAIKSTPTVIERSEDDE